MKNAFTYRTLYKNTWSGILEERDQWENRQKRWKGVDEILRTRGTRVTEVDGSSLSSNAQLTDRLLSTKHML